MGWPSYLEDIKKRAEDLDELCHQIGSGHLPYTDKNRGRITDIAKHIRRQVDELQYLLRHLEPEDGRRLDEVLGLREELSRAQKDRDCFERRLKEAELQVEKLKNERDEEKQKHQFTIRKFLREGPHALRTYLSRLGY